MNTFGYEVSHFFDMESIGSFDDDEQNVGVCYYSFDYLRIDMKGHYCDGTVMSFGSFDWYEYGIGSQSDLNWVGIQEVLCLDNMNTK